jgi:hypothetical protein
MSRLNVAIALVCACLALSGSGADAKQRQKQETHIICNRQGCSGGGDAIRTATVSEPYERGEVIGGRPAGCPQRYCGCGASLKLFGRIRPELNLASNWTRLFPRADAAPNMAAVRYGHVMVLLSHVGGSEWLVYDANSGYGLIREHVRSIQGYVIVNPSAVRTASR